MVQDNSSTQLNNQGYQIKRESASVHFDDELKEVLKQDWKYKKIVGR